MRRLRDRSCGIALLVSLMLNSWQTIRIEDLGDRVHRDAEDLHKMNSLVSDSIATINRLSLVRDPLAEFRSTCDRSWITCCYFTGAGGDNGYGCRVNGAPWVRMPGFTPGTYLWPGWSTLPPEDTAP